MSFSARVSGSCRLPVHGSLASQCRRRSAPRWAHAASGGEKRDAQWTAAASRFVRVGTQHEQGKRAKPVGPSSATSRQNDLRRISNECAVDLALISEALTRTVTSGSVRHSVLTRSNISCGTSTSGAGVSVVGRAAHTEHSRMALEGASNGSLRISTFPQSARAPAPRSQLHAGRQRPLDRTYVVIRA